MSGRPVKGTKVRQDRNMTYAQTASPTRLAAFRSASLPPDGLLCNYSLHLCHGQRLPNYDFCIRHILEDKSAPYKQCCYQLDLFPSVKCPRAAPRTTRGEGYCDEHSRAVVGARNKIGRKRSEPVSVLLDSLSHFKRPRTSPPTVDSIPSAANLNAPSASDSPPQLTVRTGIAASSSHEAPTPKQSPPPVDPFKLNMAEIRSVAQQALATQSEDSEDEDPRIDGTWLGDGDSDAESIDSDGEDPLKHAGVFTTDEIMRTMRDKLIRLQKLYIEQFYRLQYHLKEYRRTYLRQIKEEKEAGLMAIHSQPRDGAGQQDKYNQLKELSHYHAPAGREAIKANKLRKKRAMASVGYKPVQVQGCQHSLTSTTKCGETMVPLAKFCFKHIFEEPGQVLFRSCGVVTDPDCPCETPVAGLFQNSTCLYHRTIQPPVSTIQPSVSSIQPPNSSIQPSGPSIQPSVSSIQPTVSIIQPQVSSIQPLVSSIQPPVSCTSSSEVASIKKEDVKVEQDSEDLIKEGLKLGTDVKTEVEKGDETDVKMEVEEDEKTDATN